MNYGITVPDRVGTTKLTDGRALGWAQWGPTNGKPLLFFSGAAMGRSLGFGADLLASKGIRLISVDRPGLGTSDPEPNRTLIDWPTDVRQLVTALKLDNVAIIGFSHGGPFALACAAAHIAPVTVVSGQDDLHNPCFSERIPQHLSDMLQSVVTDPINFEAVTTANADPDTMWRLVIDSVSETDLLCYTHPDFQAAYRRCLAEGFSQGPAGYARDLVSTFSKWPFELETISVPVHLWYGGLDTSAVHSPDHGIQLAQRIPGAERHFLPKAGGCLLWTHTKQILDSVVS